MNNFRRKRSTAVITIIAMLFSLLTILPSEKVYANQDTTPPVVHGETLTRTLPEGKTEVESGDNVEITIEVTDADTYVCGVNVYFYNAVTGKQRHVSFSKVGDTSVWRGVFFVDDQTHNGLWEMKSISTYDSPGNSITVHRNDANGQFMANADLTVTGNNPDMSPPVVHGETLIRTLPEGKTEVESGDNVVITIEITDADTYVCGVNVYFYNAVTGKPRHVSFSKVGDTNIWKGIFYVDDQTHDGLWQMTSISTYDSPGNSITVHRNDANGQFMANADLTVTGNNPDTSPPVVHGETLIRTLPEGKTSLSEGDNAEITIEVTDEHTYVCGVNVYFYNAVTNKQRHISFSKVGDTNIWKGIFYVDDQTHGGLWQMTSISTYDSPGNSITISRNDTNGQFMANADLTVEHLLDEITLSQNSYIYDGSPKKPTVTVKNANGETLTENADYTLTYFDNINVGTATIVVKGTGQYTGTYNRYFIIKQAAISGVSLSNDTFTYDGQPKEPAVTVKNTENETLTKDVDYSVSYADNINVGTAKVTVKGIGNYTGTFTENFFINSALLGEVSLSQTTYIYDGNPKKPTVTVKSANNKTLTEGVDYSVTYADNTNVGTAKVTVTGTGQYEGIVIKNFDITKAPLGNVTLSEENYTYDGKEKKPTVTVKSANDKTLTEGIDYNVAYADNTNAGTAQVTVTGKGYYSGTITKEFTINPAPLGEAILSADTYIYDGDPKEPTVTVTNANGDELEEGTDYTVEYTDNTDIGTAQVTVTGKGNYTGAITEDFVINPGKVKVGIKLYGHDDIQGSWDAPLAPEAVTIKYKVEYKRSTWDKYALLSSAWTGTSYKKANLVDGARYRFKVTPYVEIDGATYEGAPGYSSYIYTLKKIAAPRVSKSSRNYVRLRWTNIPGESGYQISRSRYKTKGFKTVKRVSYKYSTTTAKTIRNRTYYYKIRAYKTVDGKRIYAPWSAVRAYRLR